MTHDELAEIGAEIVDRIEEKIVECAIASLDPREHATEIAQIKTMAGPFAFQVVAECRLAMIEATVIGHITRATKPDASDTEIRAVMAGYWKEVGERTELEIAAALQKMKMDTQR